MKAVQTKEALPAISAMSRRDMVRVLIVGLFVGLVAWGLSWVIKVVVLDPIFCQATNSFMVCANSNGIAGNLATVFAAVAGLFGLLRLGIFRPLLVAIAGAVTLWGLGTWLVAMTWYESLVWTLVLYGAVYFALVWLTRIRPFVIALIAVVVLVVVARLVPLL